MHALIRQDKWNDLLAKWDNYKKDSEAAAVKAWQQHQTTSRDLTKRYGDEVAKGTKLEKEVKRLTAKLQKLEGLVCAGEDDDLGEQIQRIHACPCQVVASQKLASLTKEIKDLRDEWSKDKRRLGLLKYLKEKRSKERTGYHRGYVFKEQRVPTVRTEEETGGGELLVEEYQPPKELNTRALERAARDLVENLVYLADGGLQNAAKVFERLLRNPTIKTVMQEVPGFAVMNAKDQKDLVQLKKIVGSVSLTLEKMLEHISIRAMSYSL